MLNETMRNLLTTLLLTISFAQYPQHARPAQGSTSLSQSITRSISGSVLILDEHYGFAGKPCNPYRKSFQDLKHGFSIVVRSGKGDVLATTSIPAGSLVETGKEIGATESLVMCVVTIPKFQVPDSEFYTFELAGRKPVVRSRVELESDKWKLDLTIGR
jgi:hypothetical protein